MLLFSGVTEIRSKEIPSNDHYTLITNDKKYINQAIGVAYDPTDQRVYWSDVRLKLIVSSNFTNS